MCVSLSGWGRSRMHPDLPVGVGVSQRCKRCGYPFQVDDVGHHRLHRELTSPKPVKRGRKLRARVPEGETQLQLLGNGTTNPTTMATQNRTSSTRISKVRGHRGCGHLKSPAPGVDGRTPSSRLALMRLRLRRFSTGICRRRSKTRGQDSEQEGSVPRGALHQMRATIALRQYEFPNQTHSPLTTRHARRPTTLVLTQ